MTDRPEDTSESDGLAPSPAGDLESALSALGTVSLAEDDDSLAPGASSRAIEDGWDDQVEGAEPGGAAPQSHTLEPVSAWLLKVVLALIVVLLAFTLTIVIFLTTLHKAPRTAAERNLSAAQVAVKEQPGVVDNWMKLTYAYAQVKRYDEALATARRGRAQTGKGVLWLAEADVLRASGRPSEAIPAYNQAETAVSRAETEAVAARKKIGIYVPVSDSTMARVYVGRGLAEQETGALNAAIADLERAVVITPDQATLLTTLGDFYAQAGQREKAAGAYRSALNYVPDYTAALQGLARLPEGK